ncbi:MAG: hypothetical protein FWF57_00255 [Defluviitaleaceae bacterium]|nr:hypothetical protein [Defluviitaleaceae bacterium]
MNIQGNYYSGYQNNIRQTNRVEPIRPLESATETESLQDNLSVRQRNFLSQLENSLALFERTFSDQMSLSRWTNFTGLLENTFDNSLDTISNVNITREQAEELISENGFWGVEKTARRLFDMASSLSGNNPERMEQMRQAVIDGFAAAEKTWGSTLPQISLDTFDRTMNLFDDFFAGLGN